MINRAKMPRQLRNKGGIMTIGGGGYTGIPMGSRTGFGIISKIKDRVRKLIPNELADVAVKAAPFVAPFFPGYAAVARGLGRFDQRGSISDALKQGIGTYAFGKGVGKLGGASSGDGFFGGQTFTKEGFSEGPVGRLFQGGEESTKLIDTPGGGDSSMTFTKPTKGLEFVKEGAKKLDNIPIIGELPNMVKQQILVGGVSGAATYIYEAFLKEEPPQEEGETYEEYMARRKENVGRKMKGYFDNYFKFDKDYSSMTDEQKQAFIDRVNVKDGGRIGFEEGGTGFMKWLKANYGLEVKDLDLDQYVKFSREFNNENPDPYETGREKNAKGSMPTGIMKTNKAGVMERDYRDKGGFVPVGIKEKADDVPAMLSKNEFVFTADAVRGAGNGSIEKGAQRMYDTMKNLEKRVV
jgi:hypothetical protein